MRTRRYIPEFFALAAIVFPSICMAQTQIKYHGSIDRSSYFRMEVKPSSSTRPPWGGSRDDGFSPVALILSTFNRPEETRLDWSGSFGSGAHVDYDFRGDDIEARLTVRPIEAPGDAAASLPDAPVRDWPVSVKVSLQFGDEPAREVTLLEPPKVEVLYSGFVNKNQYIGVDAMSAGNKTHKYITVRDEGSITQYRYFVQSHKIDDKVIPAQETFNVNSHGKTIDLTILHSDPKIGHVRFDGGPIRPVALAED